MTNKDVLASYQLSQLFLLPLDAHYEGPSTIWSSAGVIKSASNFLIPK